ncbi:MAG: TerB family tellurite resistance protein [Pseudomonadota bacterium]
MTENMDDKAKQLHSKLERLDEEDHDFNLRRAVAGFLFLVMPVDGHSHPKELDRLKRILADDFNLTERETEDLIVGAENHARSEESLAPMAEILRAGLSKDDLIIFVSHMWEMVFADGRLHETEIVLVERVAKLLHIPPEDVARAMSA